MDCEPPYMFMREMSGGHLTERKERSSRKYGGVSGALRQLFLAEPSTRLGSVFYFFIKISRHEILF